MATLRRGTVNMDSGEPVRIGIPPGVITFDAFGSFQDYLGCPVAVDIQVLFGSASQAAEQDAIHPWGDSFPWL